MKLRAHPWVRVIARVSCLLAMALGAAGVHAEVPHTEAAVEAAYLFRFSSYIEWPPGPAPGHSLVIDVVGDPDVARELRHLSPGHSVNDQSVQVREINSVRELGEARILYVGPGHTDFLRDLSSSAGPGLLIVTHEENGLDLGATLNFVTVDNRVRFEISLTAADRSHLKISADLLSVAIRVHGGGRQSDEFCIPLSIPQNVEVPCDIRDARFQRTLPQGLSLPSPLSPGGYLALMEAPV